MLILSTFCGIDILGKGFQEEGFCVVQAGDKILGKNIEDFHCVSNKFDGIIGGSPCQGFSTLNRNPDKARAYGITMLHEFGRIVLESTCSWFLLENVPSVPDISIKGYHVQRFDLSPTECGGTQSRRRHFQFGSKAGVVLQIEKQVFQGIKQPCLTASEGSKNNRRTWGEFCELQGLTKNFKLESLTQSAQYKAVGNAVHLGVAKTVAKAIKQAVSAQNPTIYNTNLCVCGSILEGRKKSCSPKCRKRKELRKTKDVIVILSGQFTPGVSRNL